MTVSFKIPVLGELLWWSLFFIYKHPLRGVYKEAVANLFSFWIYFADYSASRLRAIRGVETRNFASLHLFFEHVCDSNENSYSQQSKGYNTLNCIHDSKIAKHCKRCAATYGSQIDSNAHPQAKIR